MKQNGLSLIEMIVSLAILAILGSTAGYGLIGGIRAFSDNADDLRTLGKLRYASERVAREVREIRRNVVNPEEFDIAVMSETTLEFTRGNGMVVTLNVNPPLLTLAYAAPVGTWTLTDQVDRMKFVYLQQDGSLVATGDENVAFVEIDLELSRAGKSFAQRTRVALRNQQ